MNANTSTVRKRLREHSQRRKVKNDATLVPKFPATRRKIKMGKNKKIL